MATRSPALGLNTVFNRRERLNGGKVSGTVSFVWAIIEKDFRTRTRVSQRIIRYRAGYRRPGKRVGVRAILYSIIVRLSACAGRSSAFRADVWPAVSESTSPSTGNLGTQDEDTPSLHHADTPIRRYADTFPLAS